MKKIWVENDNDIQSGMCLLEHNDDYVGIAGIDFLNKESTIKDYERWERKTVNNVISLTNPEFVPQKLPRNTITSVRSFKYMADKVLLTKFEDYPRNDISFPQPLNFDFQELLIRLWDVEGNLFDYQAQIEKYYENIFHKRKEEIEDNT